MAANDERRPSNNPGNPPGSSNPNHTPSRHRFLYSLALPSKPAAPLRHSSTFNARKGPTCFPHPPNSDQKHLTTAALPDDPRSLAFQERRSLNLPDDSNEGAGTGSCFGDPITIE